MSSNKIFKACEFCKILRKPEPQFVLDHKQGCYICTICGAVQRNNGFGELIKNNTTFQEIPDTVGKTTQQKYEDRLLNVTCQHELRKERYKMHVFELCDQLDLNERARNRVWLLMENNKGVKKIRPKNTMILSCIVITMRSLKMYVDMDYIENLFQVKHFSKTLKSVCLELGINFRHDYVQSIIPKMSIFGYSYKRSRDVLREYKKMTRRKNKFNCDHMLIKSILKVDPDVNRERLCTLMNITEKNLNKI